MMSVVKKLFADVPDFRPRILLLGNDRAALAAARALRPAGYCVIMGRDGGEGVCEFSRFVEETWDHPPAETDAVAFQSALRELIARRPEIQMVLPATEIFSRFFAEEMSSLPGNVVLVSPRADVVRACSDKVTMLTVAYESDVPVLPFANLVAGCDMTVAGQDVGLPLVARAQSPGDKFNHEKAVIIENWAEYKRFVSRWCHVGNPILLQRRAVGVRRNFFFAARQGEIVSALETRTRRTDHCGETGDTVEGVTAPASKNLLADVSRIAHRLNYTGLGLAQFIVDPKTGERCFLGLSPRVVGGQAITEQMGLEMIRTAVDLALDRIPEPPKRARLIRAGFRYVWSLGDLESLSGGVAREEISRGGAVRGLTRTLWAALWAEHHQTWSWHDPIPTLMLALRQAFPGLVSAPGGAATEEPDSVFGQFPEKDHSNA